MAAKKTKTKTGKVIYASQRRKRYRNPEIKSMRDVTDWATYEPSRKFGTFANLGTCYRHNGVNKFS